MLIELVTKGPGMTVDENLDNLCQSLIIPEIYRNDNHEHLMPMIVREVDKLIGYGYRDRYECDILQEKYEIKSQIKKIKSQEVLTSFDMVKLETLITDYLKTEYYNLRANTKGLF